jgi:hypothetical protein
VATILLILQHAIFHIYNLGLDILDFIVAGNFQIKFHAEIKPMYHRGLLCFAKINDRPVFRQVCYIDCYLQSGGYGRPV